MTPSAQGAVRSGPNAMGAVLSLVIAIGLWVSFSMRGTYTITSDVQLRVAAVPDGEALRALPPPVARATFSGEGWKLLLLARGAPVVSLYADAEAVDLERAVIASGLPAGISVQGVRPQSVRLELDDRVSRRVPIRLVSAIRPDPTFGLLRPPRLFPDSVTVTGAASIVSLIDAWPTLPFVAEGIREPLRRAVALRDTLEGLVTASVRTTTVQVPVAEFTEGTRTLPVRVVNLPRGIAGVRTEPSRVRATYRVPLTAEDVYGQALRAAGFAAVVDYRDIARDTTSGSVGVAPRVPPGLDVRDVTLSPPRVEYFIVRRVPAPRQPALP